MLGTQRQLRRNPLDKSPVFWHSWNARNRHSVLDLNPLPSDERRSLLLPLVLLLSLLLSPVSFAGNPPWHAATELPARGQVTFYSPGLMEWVYEHRLRLEQVPVCDPPACVGYVAMMRAGDLGRKVWLKPAGRPAEGPFLVVDYADQRNFDALWARGQVAEVDYATAQRWDMRGPLAGVLILGESPYTQRLFLPLVGAGRQAGSEATDITPLSNPAARASRLWLPMILRGP